MPLSNAYVQASICQIGQPGVCSNHRLPGVSLILLQGCSLGTATCADGSTRARSSPRRPLATCPQAHAERPPPDSGPMIGSVPKTNRPLLWTSGKLHSN